LKFIYNKTLKVSSRSVRGVSAGRLISLAAADCEVFEQANLITSILLAPVLLIVNIFLLYLTLGPAALAMAGYTIVLLAGMQLIAKVQVGNFTRKNACGDQRLKLLSNIIESISVVKMYAWDIPYRYLVEKIWAGQIKWQRNITSLKQIHISFFTAGQGLTFLVTFATFVYSGNTLTLGDMSAAIGIILSV